MKKGLLLLVLTMLFVQFQTVFPAQAQLPTAVKAVPATASLFALNSPNGGEKWVLGTQHEIVWKRSKDVTGYITIDLYRGGTSAQNKIGTIASGISVSLEKYSWIVGTLQGGTAPAGDDYKIVIRAGGKSDTSNGAFSIMAKAEVKEAASLKSGGQSLGKIAPATTVKMVSLTYPRRADLLHKGIGYKITWKSINLKNAKMKLELLDIHGTTVVRTIGEDFVNAEEFMWYIDNLLPDQETMYKVRIQTMDGAAKDTAGPFKIAKGTPPPGTPKLTVTNPGQQDRAAGDVIPVKWTTTTTCNTSQDGPVRNEVFLVEQIDGSGKLVAGGMQGPAEFLGEGPTGYLNWQRKLTIGGTPGPQTRYQVRVTSKFGCSNISPVFRVITPTDAKLYVYPMKHKTICFYTLFKKGVSHESTFANQISKMHGVLPSPQYPVVAFKNYFSPESGASVPSYIDQYVVRSRVFFHDSDQWYKGLGSVREAKLVIKRLQKANTHFAAYSAPCLGGVALLTANPQPDCSGWDQVHYSPSQQIQPVAPLPGAVAVDTSQGDTWTVDLTQQYRALVDQGKRDGGIMLFPSRELLDLSGYHDKMNAEVYSVELRIIFEKKR